MSKAPLLLKAIVMGSGGVGKSALTLRFMYDEFIEEYKPTKVDNYRKASKIEEIECLLDILDTAGQEDYSVVREAYYKDGEGFWLVFAINDLDSFTALEEFHEQILGVKGADTPIPFLLVGNKADLEDYRAVSTSEAEKCASKWNCPYIETSAKSCHNVQEAFMNLFTQIRNSEKNAEPVAETGKEKERGNKCCCTVL